jgi:ferric-dicitrate binding protein FerR (iron transport regulator)
MASEKQTSQLVPGRVVPMRWLRISAAAAVVAVVITLTLLWRPTVAKQVFQNPIALSENNIEKTNDTKQPLSVLLQDSSTVLLQPGSTLRYPQVFGKLKREVFLEGEAFFQVAKQSGHPFLVYTKNIVTQVLGTSFNVRTDPQKQELEVAVRTGRVQVYEQSSVLQKKDKKGNGVLLLPNQKVVYQETSRRFIASLVDVPLPVREQKTATAETQKDLYEETALAAILPALEAR